ncbi:HNH endonuclease [Anaerobacillus sp. CMMVII]|uniref:HNH endonuclease signature motif containing protein n=1 Tax=Anaerobacillus sp. CMMVII TaxID=2755588 RepID=UPI0021B81D1E|nr:HNH endonuclease signature motif containing protein [Anaerobacillus sp. CMMVII]MCT8138952.1 HNH endonuclease [Anaerobacillus sp. CMMVII]
MKTQCDLCRRGEVETTVHHLIPREMGGNYGPIANLCIPCHKQTHALYTNEQLAGDLFTIERLQNEEQMIRYLNWIKKQPPTTLPRIKKSNALKKKR